MPGPGAVTRGYSCSTEMPVPGLVGRDVCGGRGGGCFQHPDFMAEGVTFSNITICCCTGELWDHPHITTIPPSYFLQFVQVPTWESFP